MKQRIKLLVISLFALTFLTSCNEEVSVMSAYKYGLSTFFSNSTQDLSTISDYLASKNISLNEVFMITGESVSKNNETAISQFNTLVETVTVDEIGDLGLDDGTYFTLVLLGSSTDPNADTTLASYSYPVE